MKIYSRSAQLAQQFLLLAAVVLVEDLQRILLSSRGGLFFWRQ